jgi:hypothetical protein
MKSDKLITEQLELVTFFIDLFESDLTDIEYAIERGFDDDGKKFYTIHLGREVDFSGILDLIDE